MIRRLLDRLFSWVEDPPPSSQELFLLATHRGRKAKQVWTSPKPAGFGGMDNPLIDRLEVWATPLRHHGSTYYEARIYCYRGILLGKARLKDHSPPLGP
jgi:hypothetical protein